jgi:hypothetical protein
VGEFACLRPKVEFANSNEQGLAAVKKSEPTNEGNGFPKTIMTDLEMLPACSR